MQVNIESGGEGRAISIVRWLPWIKDMPYTSLVFLQYFLLPPYLSTGRSPVANGGGCDESADEVVEGVFPFVYLNNW